MISVVIQSSCFDRTENMSFSAALGSVHIPCMVDTDGGILEQFQTLPDALFRGSCEMLLQCPWRRAALATPMHVFNELHYRRFVQGIPKLNNFQKPFFSGKYADHEQKDNRFIRCVSGDKRMTGDVFPKYEASPQHDRFWEEFNELPEYTICVSSPEEQKLENEVRFVVFRDTVITGSEYVDCKGKIPLQHTEATKEQMDDASKLLHSSLLSQIEIRFTEPYTLDIAYVGGVPKFLEINSFWSAGLYGCNVEKVIRKLHKHNYFV